jgi:hypothetical protein
MDSCKTGQELVDMLELLRRAFASIGPALNILQGKNDKRVFEGIVFCIGLQNWQLGSLKLCVVKQKRL